MNELKTPGQLEDTLILLRDVTRTYRSGDEKIDAIRDVNLSVERGAFVAVTGPSGSGKSTLLNVVGCLDRPSRGSYRLGGREVTDLDNDALASVRSQLIGFVFQSYNLLPRIDALDNVALPLLYRGMTWRQARQRAEGSLEQIGARELSGRLPRELSGGQQQRVSIARAIVGAPEIILADEPTGALEKQSSDAIMEVLERLNADGQTLLVITHDPRVASRAGRQLAMDDGQVLQTVPGAPHRA